MEHLYGSFLYDGRTADDFYFTYDPNGRKIYYARRTGKRSAVSRIPKHLIGQIKERPQNLEKAKLLKQRSAFVEQIKKLNEKVAEIDRKLDGQDDVDYDYELKKEQEKQRASQEREREERRKFFEKIFGQNKGTGKEPPSKKHKTKDSQTSEDILKNLGITTKKEWKQWLLKNHPDKGGKDETLCKKVIDCGRNMGW